MATTAEVLQGIASGSYADLLFELLERMEAQLECANLKASSWSTNLVQVPAAGPGIQGAALCAPDPRRLEVGLFSLNTSGIIYVAPNNSGSVPPAPGTGMPIQPLAAMIFDFRTAGLQRFAISAVSGGSVVVALATA